MQKRWGVLIFVTLAVGAGIYFSRGPWQAYQTQKQRTAESLTDMKRAEEERTELMRQRAKYESAIGREELARSRNYRMPNEVPLDMR